MGHLHEFRPPGSARTCIRVDCFTTFSGTLVPTGGTSRTSLLRTMRVNCSFVFMMPASGKKKSHNLFSQE
jgi:hypothetical protein